jgi:hypothetical protein
LASDLYLDDGIVYKWFKFLRAYGAT